MGIETAILMGISAAGSAASIIQGANAKAEANQAASQAAASLAQMQEADKFKSLQVPTLGLQMAQQNAQARQAQQLQGLKDVGASGVLGGLTAVNTQAQNEDLALAAQAQQAQYARDLAQAENAQGVEQRNLARQTGLQQQRLAGAQNAAAYGQSQINSGISGLAQMAGNAAIANFSEKPLFDQQQQLQAQGLAKSQGFSNQMYNRGQDVLKTPIQTGLQSIPNITPVSPQQIQANNMAGLRAAQGQYELAGVSPFAPKDWNQQYAPYPWASLGF